LSVAKLKAILKLFFFGIKLKKLFVSEIPILKIKNFMPSKIELSKFVGSNTAEWPKEFQVMLAAR
jgi:hypothetical protein